MSLIYNSGGRNVILDVSKFYLICLVVLGHVLLESEYYYSNRFIRATISWIWTFHMPAFIFISGYLTNLNKSFKETLKSIIGIFSSYLVMQTIMSILYGFTLFDFILIPQYGIWYLWALPIWRLITFLCYRNEKVGLALFGVSIICAVLSGYVPIDSICSVQRILSFYPLFLLGIIFQNKNWISKIRNKYRILCLIFLVVIFLIFFGGNRMILTGACNSQYKDISQMLFRSGSLLLGFFMSIAFICSVPVFETAAKYGKRSLFIYCYHVFFIVNLIPNIWIKFNIVSETYFYIYSFLIIIFLCLLSNIKILNKLISPLR